MAKKDRLAIEVRDLGITFRDKSGTLEVLRDINMDVEQREFVCVLGPSGSGKTTLLRILAGLDEPSEGMLAFTCWTKPCIGLVFQESNLMPWRTVLDNILLPMEILGRDREESMEKACELIELIGLEDFMQAWPSSLSGGMAQRVAIARALIQDPDLLLLDEPFGSLDALTREKMGSELLRIWQATRKTVIMVTHYIPEALLLADRVLVLSQLPARIKLDLKVDLPRPRDADARYSKKFRDLSRKLHGAIEM